MQSFYQTDVCRVQGQLCTTLHKSRKVRKALRLAEICFILRHCREFFRNFVVDNSNGEY